MSRLSLRALSAAAALLVAALSTGLAAEEFMPVDLFIRRFYGLPADLKIAIGPAKPGPVPGLEVISLTLGEGARAQQVEVFRSADGRHLTFGPLFDLSKDPFEARASQIDLKERAALGRSDAPVTIVEYSDFQCPFCRKMSPVVRETMQGALGKDVRWVYKHFPLTGIHPWAEPAAVAAECARQVGGNAKFWSLHDVYFDEQEKFTLENHRARVVDWARRVGLSAGRFERCLDGKEARARVQADMAEGRRLGVESTPTLVINGRVAPGARSGAEMKTLIEVELEYQRRLGRASDS